MAKGDKPKGKGKGKGKLIGIVLGVLVLLGGTVVGLGIKAVIKIPGLSPRKKIGPSMYGELATKLYGDAKEATPEPTKEEPKVVEQEPEEELPPVPPPDLVKGAESLAEVWNSVPNEKLIKIVDKWKNEDLARVFSKMETEKVAQLLAEMKPERASILSEEMRDQASKVAIAN